MIQYQYNKTVMHYIFVLRLNTLRYMLFTYIFVRNCI